jgi:GT2 family glycosyltransferase
MGGFRDDFFMYGEDVDLCERVLQSGLTIAVVPDARVWHHEPARTGVSDTVAFHKVKNFVALYLLHAEWRVIPVFALRYGVLGFVRALTTTRAELRTFVRGWAWALRNAPRLLGERRGRARQEDRAARTGRGAARAQNVYQSQ